MASKEVMATAPLLVLLFERTFVSGSFRTALEKSWPLYAGLAATWLLLLALNASAPRGDTAGFHLGVPALTWWLTQSKVLWMYLKLCVWPWPLVIHYHVPYLNSLGEAWMYALPVALLAIGTLVLLWRRHATGFLAACVFAILAPTLLVPITTEVAAERRMYLPLAALVTLAVVGGYSLLERVPQRRQFAAALAAALTLCFGLVGAQRLEAYRDPVVLWEDTLAKQPENAMAQHNLGVELQNTGRLPAAIDHYRAAVRLKPEFLEAQTNLGLALSRAGQPAEAIEHFQAAVRIKPQADRIRNNLGVALFTAGRLDEAIAEFQEVIKLKPEMWESHDNLARALERAGRPDEANIHFDEAARLQREASASAKTAESTL
jgi:tetratricopeptide (TPR) repeat protein